MIPLYHAQLALFADAHEGPELLYGAKSRGALVMDHHETFVVIRNRASQPALLLPGDSLRCGWVSNCSALVPPSRSIRVPSLCIRAGLACPPVRVRPVSGAVGVMVLTRKESRVDLFGSVPTCHKAWTRILARRTFPAPDTAIRDVEGLLSRLFRLTWDRVRPVGLGKEWIGQAPGTHATALFLGRHLIHLRMCFTRSLIFLEFHHVTKPSLDSMSVLSARASKVYGVVRVRTLPIPHLSELLDEAHRPVRKRWTKVQPVPKRSDGEGARGRGIEPNTKKQFRRIVRTRNKHVCGARNEY